MIIPVGSPFMVQNLILVEKGKSKTTTKSLMPVRFVPFTYGISSAQTIPQGRADIARSTGDEYTLHGVYLRHHSTVVQGDTR